MVSSLILQPLQFLFGIVFMFVGEYTLGVEYEEEQTEDSGEQTGQDLPSEGKVDCSETLLGSHKNPESVINHQYEEYQLEKVPDDAEHPQ